MNTLRRTHIVVIAAVIGILTTGFVVLSSTRYHKELSLTNERELKVTLESGFGTINIAGEASDKLLNLDVESERSGGVEDCLEYVIRDGIGYMTINTSDEVQSSSRTHRKESGFRLNNIESSSWNMRFTKSIPISFDISLGLGKGDFNFTGLSVKDLNISSGASSVVMEFDTPNPSIIEQLSIETGLSKFHAQGLCNANFEHLRFEGGVGSYYLNFDGNLDREVDVEVEVGLGTLTIELPEQIGAKILYEESWIAHIDLGRSFTEQEDNTYFSENYNTADGRMNIHIQAGLGSVKVKRR